jgi:hypothetical protein
MPAASLIADVLWKSKFHLFDDYIQCYFYKENRFPNAYSDLKFGRREGVSYINYRKKGSETPFRLASF